MDQTSSRKASRRYRNSLHRFFLYHYSFQRANIEMGLREFSKSANIAQPANSRSLWQPFLPLFRCISATPD
jgi:hypothetical protein